MVFRAAPGAPYNDKAAQVIGEELQAMRERGVEVTPESVVEQAADQNSRLHKFFDWNDTTAAESWRKQQARSIVNHLMIVTVVDDSVKLVKAEFSVTFQPRKDLPITKRYVSVNTVLDSPVLLGDLRQAAIQELRHWAEKYSGLGLREFGHFYKMIESLGKQ